MAGMGQEWVVGVGGWGGGGGNGGILIQNSIKGSLHKKVCVAFLQLSSQSHIGAVSMPCCPPSGRLCSATEETCFWETRLRGTLAKPSSSFVPMVSASRTAFEGCSQAS